MGKTILGSKRDILIDTLGLLLDVGVHPAKARDRDGGEALLRQAHRRFPFIERIMGDGGYAGPRTTASYAGIWVRPLEKDGVSRRVSKPASTSPERAIRHGCV